MMMNKLGRNSNVVVVVDGGGSMSDASEESIEFEVRRGPWTLEEDNLLIHYITFHGEGRWNSLAKFAGLKRTGKSCRLRWLNYLKPDIKRGNLTPQEQLLILELHSKLGNKWSKIAQHLPGRTDNEIKNYWRTRVQKQARQLNVDSNSRKFLEAIRSYWMPRLVEKMEQKNYSSSFTVPPSPLLKHHSQNEVQDPTFAISSSSKNLQDLQDHQNKENSIHLLMKNSILNKGSSSDSLKKMQHHDHDDDEIFVENHNTIFDYTYDECYHVDTTTTAYNLEDGFEMSAMELSHHRDIINNNNIMSENDHENNNIGEVADFFNGGDNMVSSSSNSSLWNLDDLWHFRKSEVGM